MLYVENLPSFTTPELLGKLFSPFGTILHISLPKHKEKEIKGFAFIELDVSHYSNYIVKKCSKKRFGFE